MVRVILRPSFQKDLQALRRNHRQNYAKTTAVLVDLQTGNKPLPSLRAESRIPDAVKYELSEGYRLVFQKVDGSDAIIALSVGTHERVEAFLDGHRGWVFDERTGALRELRLATIEESATEKVPSEYLAAAFHPGGSQHEAVAVPVLAELTAEMLARLEVPAVMVAQLRTYTDANALEFTNALEELESSNPTAAGLLLSYATGDVATRGDVLRVARGESVVRVTLASSDLPAVERATDEFVEFDDAGDLQAVLERESFEQWLLFLHPDQKALVERTFNGPARLRGISGSGKTVVALHRARALARKYPGSHVLFTTFNKALARAAGRLLDTLCGPDSLERAAIHVTHLHGWCLDFVQFVGVKRPIFDPKKCWTVFEQARKELHASQQAQLSALPADYLKSEIDFIIGRFLPDEVDAEYMGTDRSGRERALPATQRSAVLALYNGYFDGLRAAGLVDSGEFVRIAYHLRRTGEAPQREYAAVIVDEVQDIPELGLRLLHGLVGSGQDGLLLVGDDTQRIFTRGFSMRGLGIDVTGRSLFLRKNYRNTREILGAAFPLVQQAWEADLATIDVSPEAASPLFSARTGSRPAIVRCRSVAEEAQFLRREVQYLLKYHNYQPRDICVMGRSPYYRKMALTALRDAGIPVISYKPENDAPGLGSEEGGFVSTVHSAKGHEFAAVFLVGLVEGSLPHAGVVEPAEVANEAALLYVGMTRARDLVYLSYSGMTSNGTTQRPSRFLDSLAEKCDLLEFRTPGQ